MIKRRVLYVVIGAVVALSFASCVEDKQQKVDQQYLNAQDYSSFKKSTDQEIKNNDNSKSFADQLAKVSDCGVVSDLGASFSLNWEALESLTGAPESCRVEEDNQQLTLMGEQSLQQITVRWFLQEYQSAYRDAEVIVATFSDNELRSYNTVGMYEKIPARDIKTNISVNNETSRLVIRSETIRDIKYPLEQKNTITAEYVIDTDGGINELR